MTDLPSHVPRCSNQSSTASAAPEKELHQRLGGSRKGQAVREGQRDRGMTGGTDERTDGQTDGRELAGMEGAKEAYPPSLPPSLPSWAAVNSLSWFEQCGFHEHAPDQASSLFCMNLIYR